MLCLNLRSHPKVFAVYKVYIAIKFCEVHLKISFMIERLWTRRKSRISPVKCFEGKINFFIVKITGILEATQLNFALQQSDRSIWSFVEYFASVIFNVWKDRLWSKGLLNLNYVSYIVLGPVFSGSRVSYAKLAQVLCWNCCQVNTALHNLLLLYLV